ncbi:MAG TPA: alpha/beta hydrolase [Allosphingosinicella sp.]|jgi:polyhydroxyalkanoate synthase
MSPSVPEETALSPKLAAPQHRPRPLPLFLELLRSETAAEPVRMGRALEGLRMYQEAPREPPRAPMPAVAERCGAALRDYGGSGPPVVFIPSLINPPTILDLAPERSLLRWLAMQGVRPLLLDWGWDVEARRALGVGGHIEDIAVPLIAALGERPALVGYCLGGTMALAAAARVRAPSVATIAAPWHFDGFPAESRGTLAKLWAGAQPTAKALGVLPMEVLQSAFWSLDPARTVSKFEGFAALEPGSDKGKTFVTLEDWANDGPPLGEAAAREMFEGFFAADLPGRGAWTVAGQTVDPAALPCPLFNIVSATDRIVPEDSAPRAGETLRLQQGHVGMVVGSRARESLWEPLAAWLSRNAGGC